MEFFGITLFGPQNYIRDIMQEEYKEPLIKEDVEPLMEAVYKYSTSPKQIQRPDIDTIRLIDCYIGRVNGFAYGSRQTFAKMKRKGVIKPVGPADIYRMPPTTSTEDVEWNKTKPRYPQPSSPNTLILDKVRKNNKYATLF
ncbi:uncharacterized protein [Epargyreus clarus]|uniref:uncharacterized protein isoform X2 n=1 Tax=Epargyreus clarus TaxID=520877 RepID=UPI003C2D096F